jgi:hypothetical protein
VGLFSSKTKTTQDPFETNPWLPQQDYLKTGFGAAKTALNSNLATNAAIPDFTADMNGVQTGALSASNSFNQGLMPSANGAVAAGSAAVGGLGGYQANANSLYTNAGADRTGSIINSAGQFANNPGLQGQIDSALGDVRKAFDQNLSGINSDASATGNINSTRAGVVESLARDDAMDRSAQISSQMRGDAWNNGLSLASQNMSDQFSQQAGANTQLGNSVGLGLDTMSTGADMGQGALGQQFINGSLTQAQAQAEIEGLRAKGMSEQDIVAKYMGNVGGSYGQQGFTSTTTTSPSIFQQVLGGAASVAGAYAGLK